MSSKKLNGAADKSSPVAMMGNYVNAVKGKKQKSSKNDPQPGDLIIVQCYAGESMSYMKVLIDSGNQLSTISEDALKRTSENKNIVPTNIQMTTAQGSTFEVRGKVSIDLQIGTKDYTCNLIVTPVLFTGVDIILGSDFFSKYHTKLITYPHKDPLFVLENKVIPLVKSNVNEGTYQVFNIVQEEDVILGVARAWKPVIIPAWDEGYIKVKLPKSLDKNKYNKLLFEPTEFECFEDLHLLESAIRPHETNNEVKYSWVKYRNYSAYPHEIPKGYILGDIVEYEDLTSQDEDKMEKGVYINAVKICEDRWSKIKEKLLERIDKNPEIEERLLRVFKKHQKTVSLEHEILGTTDTVVHRIEYEGPDNNYTPPYPVPKSEREDLSKEVKNLLQQDKIEVSTSCHNTPVIPIRKRSGELRLVFNFKKINHFTAKNKYPLPRIDEILYDLHGGKVFSCLDMKSGYSQVKLHPDSRPLTAFTVPEGRYQHVVLPQGLQNAPACFQALMCNVVGGLTPNIFCFLDDILIVSENYDDHEKHLNLALERLEKHNLSIRLDKCEFFKSSVKYLGFKVGSEGIAPLPEKVQAIQQYPTPQDLYQLRSFLGLTSYYRRFIKNYSELSAPLSALTHGHPKKGKKVKINWDDQAEASFQKLKQRMVDEVILQFPDYSKPFRLCTDASDLSIGGVLSQVDENGHERPITFFSKVLSDTEKKYSTLEREALGLVHGLRIHKPIIGSFPVEVVSDNAPLVHLMKNPSNNSRVARWFATTLDFDITNYRHLSGKLNVPADILSRRPVDLVDDIIESLPVMAAIAVRDQQETPTEIYWDINELKILQARDPLYSEIKKFISGKRANLPRNLSVPLNQFEIQSQVLYFKNINAYGKDRFQVCIPKDYIDKALKLAHSSPVGGHSGEQHTIHKLKKFAFWPSMRKDAISFVRKCTTCMKYKKIKIPPVPTLRSPQVTRPFECVHTDLVGPLPVNTQGNKYIVTFIDVLTRFAVATPIPNKTAETVARAIFEKLFCVYGICENLVSDNGTEYTNDLLDRALKYMKVTHRKVTCYRPSANGVIENLNKTLMNILRSQVSQDETEWDRNICLSVFSYNVGHNRTIKDSPWFLMFGRDPKLPHYSIFQIPTPWYNIDSYKHRLASTMHSIFNTAQKYIEAGQLSQETYKNRNAKKRDLKVGDRVYVQRKAGKGKIKNEYLGPYRLDKLSGVIAWVKNIATGVKIRIHSERLKLEDYVDKSECLNARACFPVKVNELEWLDFEKEFTNNDREEDDDISNVTETEQILNRELTVSYKPVNEQIKYRTRSQGPVPEVNWILEK